MTVGEFKQLISDMDDDAKIIIVDDAGNATSIDADTSISKYYDALILYV